MYVRPEDLAEAVRESQAGGTITPDLYRYLVLIVEGVGRVYQLTDLDDLHQDVAVVVLKNLHRLDPTRNLFDYLTSLVISVKVWQHRQRVRYEEGARKFYRDRRVR